MKWIDALPDWLSKFSFIPYDKNSNKFAPMFSLSTWMGYGWTVDLVCVSQDEDRRENRLPLSTEFPSKAVRRAAPLRPNGLQIQ